MRKDDSVRQEVLIRLDCLSQILVSSPEMRVERIGPKIDGEFQRTQQRKQFPMPLRGTLGTESDIALMPGTGKAEAHRNNRDSGAIVGPLTRDPKPGAQAVAATIIPRHPRLMDSASRRLTDQDNPRSLVRDQQRSWP